MGLRSRMLTGLLAAALLPGAGAALAQDATPSASPDAPISASPNPASELAISRVTLSNPTGEIVAYIDVTEDEGGVTFTIESTKDSGLEPGEHGLHIHEYGTCDASGATPYESAGGHFNPTDADHGDVDADDSHAGDLGNLVVNDDGTIDFEVTTDNVTLDPDAENSLAGPNGSSLIVHEGADDLESQPSGDSGGRVACALLFKSNEPMPNYSPPAEDAAPDASPDATPAS